MRREALTGDWWLPSAPERQVHGTLSYEPDGYPELKLQGALSDGKDATDPPIVLGRTGDGPVTAEVEFQTNLAHGFSYGVQTVRQSFAVRLAIVGAHLPDPKDRRFSQISLDLTDIWLWTGWPGPGAHGSSPDEVAITYSQPPELSADVEWGRVRLFGTRTESQSWSRASLEVGARFLCERPVAAPLETWLAEVVGPLRDLLSIATDRANQVVEIGVILPDEHAYARVIYSATHVDLPADIALPMEFPFTATSISAEFEAVLKRWFEVRRHLGRALALYLGTQYRASDLPETRLLNIAAAAEAYHRRATRPDAQMEEAHRQRATRIDAALAMTDLASRDRSFVRRRLKKDEEPTLESRLSDMARRCEGVLQPSLGDPAAFGKRVADARNLLVHNDPVRLPDLPDGRSILDMYEDLALVFLVCLYQDLGFEDDRIRRGLQATRRWRFLEYRKRVWGS